MGYTASSVLSLIYDAVAVAIKVKQVDSAGTVTDPATETTLAIVAGDTTSLDAKQPALGSAAMAASSPVTIATDDTITAAANALLTTIDADTGAISTVSGTTADAAVSTDTTGTISGKIRGLVKILADVWDSSNNLVKTQDQSPIYSRHTSPVQLVTSAQDLTGAMVTMGAVIGDLTGYKYLRVPFLLDGNDSRSVQIQVTYEIAASGSLNIPFDPNKWTVRYSSLDTDQKIRTLTGTIAASVDDWFSLEIELDNAPPAEIKIQVMAGTVGGTAGQIDNAYYIKGY